MAKAAPAKRKQLGGELKPFELLQGVAGSQDDRPDGESGEHILRRSGRVERKAVDAAQPSKVLRHVPVQPPTIQKPPGAISPALGSGSTQSCVVPVAFAAPAPRVPTFAGPGTDTEEAEEELLVSAPERRSARLREAQATASRSASSAPPKTVVRAKRVSRASPKRQAARGRFAGRSAAKKRAHIQQSCQPRVVGTGRGRASTRGHRGATPSRTHQRSAVVEVGAESYTAPVRKTPVLRGGSRGRGRGGAGRPTGGRAQPAAASRAPSSSRPMSRPWTPLPKGPGGIQKAVQWQRTARGSRH
eukprot:gnl/TRDRNA2_/TRDRNA2_81797_c0_seq1.p1 gnl/TRDRNA2_/TRDRNA2_81797_c0~~gnl/TRDRNA2_/TRDRNA2_81797_c0_seq1.p1  ORF type:complete len:315 (+),score=32.53 gnl/TRDRNA2_/TRDRNA2_81797_c0_seq1:42-947(+)